MLLHAHVQVGCVGRCTYTYVSLACGGLCCCSSGAVQLFIEPGSPRSLEHIKYTRLWALGIHLPPPPRAEITTPGYFYMESGDYTQDLEHFTNWVVCPGSFSVVSMSKRAQAGPEILLYISGLLLSREENLDKKKGTGFLHWSPWLLLEFQAGRTLTCRSHGLNSLNQVQQLNIRLLRLLKS